MRLVTYRDIARLIARAETDEEREHAGVLLVWYDDVGRESTRERMRILREELQAELSREVP
jgi:hypothetical protein